MAGLFKLETIDMADRLHAMIQQEQSPSYICRDYLHILKQQQGRSISSRRNPLKSNPKRVCPTSRRKVVRWLYDIVDYFALQRETVAMAMSYTDRFMGTSSPQAHQASRSVTTYQLVAVACLLIATKTIDRIQMDAEVLATASRGCYSVEEITSMEKTILMALEWRLSGPTAWGVAQHIIALMNKVVDKNSQENWMQSAFDFTKLQIELSVCEYETCVLRTPSTVALASVWNSIELLDFTTEEMISFSMALSDLTGMNARSREVRRTMNELNGIFDRSTEEVMNRASESGVNSSKSKTSSFLTQNIDATPSRKQGRFRSASSPTTVNGLFPEIVHRSLRK